MFSEYYPSATDTSITYLQEQKVQTKRVSYLWPLSGIFSATNALMQLKGEKEQFKSYLDSIVTAVEMYKDTVRMPAGYQAYPPLFGEFDRYYDDNGLVAIEYVNAYMNTHHSRYLKRAKEVFHFILSGWSGTLGGGVTWLEGHEDQKPACSNGMATLAALKLYQATCQDYYLNWGKRFYNWMYDNLRDSTGLYWNDKKTADSTVNKTYWTYNSGSMLQATVLLYHFTKEEKYLREAQRIAASAYKKFGRRTKSGIISILDLPWFTTVLFRGYEALYKVDNNPEYVNVIINNLNWAWKHARDQYGLIYNDWNAEKDESKTPKWLLDEACIAELYARAIDITNN